MVRLRACLAISGIAFCCMILVFQHEYKVLLDASMPPNRRFSPSTLHAETSIPPPYAAAASRGESQAMTRNRAASDVQTPSHAFEDAQTNAAALEPSSGPEKLFHDLYGTTPHIIGLERCAKMHLAVTGLFNTGTNLMAELFRNNCFVRKGSRRTPSSWQVPWGKHRPLTSRGEFYVKGAQGVNVSTVMPVMVVRDPLTWMKSMCRNPYAAKMQPRLKDCRSISMRSSVNVSHPDITEQYSSLVEYWSKWNGLHLHATFPRLIVRFEDLAFNQEATVRHLCGCVGGFVPEKFVLSDQSTKLGHSGHGRSPKSNRQKLVAQLLNESYREGPYSLDEQSFFNQNVDAELMRELQYEYPRR